MVTCQKSQIAQIYPVKWLNGEAACDYFRIIHCGPKTTNIFFWQIAASLSEMVGLADRNFKLEIL